MSDYENESYYDEIAEAWEGATYGGAKSGGGSKKKAKPTTGGKQRVGSVAWVGGTIKVCAKGCAKKCCSAAKTTPSLR